MTINYSLRPCAIAYNNSFRTIPCVYKRQTAIATGFIINHDVQNKVALEPDPEFLQTLRNHQNHGDPSLIILRPSAINDSIFHYGIIRGTRPNTLHWGNVRVRVEG
ncbi:hypothetical protein MoryE10_05250 [Methylogaea oryzae]|uniref:Uncharacterized protein n=1 Tax=Methylogaea oryzae TaxID=1295382 RepID=A0A8D4VNR7_9GAMM|nr:hypothetical protein MoryE10_05250 [Methylogaea oryzae]